MILSDSHCHLDRIEPEELAGVIEQAKSRNVGIMVSMGMDLESSVRVINLAKSHQEVQAAIGIHPWNAVPPTDELRHGLEELARSGHAVAIGEIGLDYARVPETKEAQKELLSYELSLARETGLPVNIHCREAHQDMMSILRQEAGSGLKGAIHGFSGDSAALRDWLDLGFYVSLGVRGFVSEATPALEAAVREIPVDRLLTETDATGGEQSAGPTAVVSVAEKLASLRGIAVEEVADAATANLKRLLNIK